MAKPENKGQGQQAGGRQNAPGQNKPRLFVHQETGDQVTGTMNDFHNTLKDQGYRPIEEVASVRDDVVIDGDIPEDEPVQ